MVSTRWSAIDDLVVLHNAMDRLFSKTVGAGGRRRKRTLAAVGQGYMPLDVYRTADGWVVRAGVPGADPECVTVTCEGSFIRVKRETGWPEEVEPLTDDPAPDPRADLDRVVGPSEDDVTSERTAASQLPDSPWPASPADEAKLNFLLRVSEALRQPITLLSGYMDMIQEGTISDPKDVVPILLRKTAELNVLISNLLERARTEAW